MQYVLHLYQCSAVVCTMQHSCYIQFCTASYKDLLGLCKLVHVLKIWHLVLKHWDSKGKVFSWQTPILLGVDFITSHCTQYFPCCYNNFWDDKENAFEGRKELVCPNMVTFAERVHVALKLCFRQLFYSLQSIIAKLGRWTLWTRVLSSTTMIIILIINFTHLKYYSIVR